MSDQADHLRQLVEAHRVWRELALEEDSATGARALAQPGRSLVSGRSRWNRLLSGDFCMRFWAARAARWILSHVGR
jgi:hypothetical protein